MWEKIFFQRIHKSHEAYNLEFPSSQVNLTQNTITITQMKTKSYRFFKMRKNDIPLHNRNGFMNISYLLQSSLMSGWCQVVFEFEPCKKEFTIRPSQLKRSYKHCESLIQNFKLCEKYVASIRASRLFGQVYTGQVWEEVLL